jgi:hypothetical protein
VLAAVSDNPDAGAACGGSHWSLLAFHAPTNAFVHIDSSPGAGNAGPARALAGALSPLVRRRRRRRRGGGGGGGGGDSGGGGGGGDSGGAVAHPSFEACPHAPRQANGHDCGVYVLALARQLCAWAASPGGAAGLPARLAELPGLVTPCAVAALRGELLGIIEGLAAGGGGGSGGGSGGGGGGGGGGAGGGGGGRGGGCGGGGGAGGG